MLEFTILLIIFVTPFHSRLVLYATRCLIKSYILTLNTKSCLLIPLCISSDFDPRRSYRQLPQYTDTACDSGISECTPAAVKYAWHVGKQHAGVSAVVCKRDNTHSPWHLCQHEHIMSGVFRRLNTKHSNTILKHWFTCCHTLEQFSKSRPTFFPL